ncbi:MAG: hypothetical protein Q9182_006671 [Xanthomendoza sp. 2 TL-2023]
MAGEELINVPLSALVTINNVPESFREQKKQITVQGLLASFLASTDIIDTAYAPWVYTWPTLADFRKALPLFWPQDGTTVLTAELLDESSVHGKLGVPLTPAIEHPAFRGSEDMSCSTGTVGLLQEQRRKLSADWKITNERLPKTKYTLDSNGVCYRTEVAIRTQTLSEDEWSGLVAGRYTEKPEDERKAQALIASQLLDPFLREANSVLKCLRDPSSVPNGPPQILVRRWRQIRAMLQQTAFSLTVHRQA